MAQPALHLIDADRVQDYPIAAISLLEAQAIRPANVKRDPKLSQFADDFNLVDRRRRV